MDRCVISHIHSEADHFHAMLEKKGFAEYGYRFRYKTPRFRYAAKESQSRYGIWSFAASGLTL